MRVFTVTCDGRPAAMVAAPDPSSAIAMALELADERNLLGVIGPRRFAARAPSPAEMAEWSQQRDGTTQIILEAPLATE
jgi:hypothetical protein